MPPPLLNLADWPAYQQHFVKTLCNGQLITHDGITVYFKRHSFYHAFFESSVYDDDSFSEIRAQRMEWISATLINPAADRFQGWNSKTRQHDPVRRVDVVFEDFVVVLQMIKRQDANLAAQFITCYQADRSIAKIRKSPLWDRESCEKVLFGK
jgi:hypothetical protein